jgi:hypothetical protein
VKTHTFQVRRLRLPVLITLLLLLPASIALLLWQRELLGTRLLGALVIGSAGAFFAGLRWLATSPQQLSLTPNGLEIKDLRAAGADPQLVPWTAVLSYYELSRGDNYQLQLRLADGQRIRLTQNGIYGPTAPLAAVGRRVKLGLQRFRRLHPEYAYVGRREPTFYEKPLGTVVLVLLVAGALGCTGLACVRPVAKPYKLLTAYTGVLAYYFAWRQARQQGARADGIN